jgi:predicted acyltransferase
VFLRSLDSANTNWTFEDVVTQIGFGYVPLFLVWQAGRRIQIVTLFVILIGTWLLFVLWPISGESNEFSGFFAHWNKVGNPAHDIDQWFLNLFPRDTQFVANEGGYYTLNFIPSLATMILGLLAGNVLYEQSASESKLRRLIIGGFALLVAGVAMHFGRICPIVKKIWTPSFILASGGLCLWTLALLYYLVDVRKWHRISFPARVVGMNSMAMYCMIYMISGWLARNLLTHFGTDVFTILGSAYKPFLLNLTVGTCLWLICFWMYKRQLFLRI